MFLSAMDVMFCWDELGNVIKKVKNYVSSISISCEKNIVVLNIIPFKEDGNACVWDSIDPLDFSKRLAEMSESGGMRVVTTSTLDRKHLIRCYIGIDKEILDEYRSRYV